MRAEVDVANDTAALRPGMYATGLIELDRRDNALTLPTTAILRNGAEAACMIVAEGKATRLPVEIGLRVGPDTEIIGGLSETSNVIVIRPEAAADGQRVEPLTPTSGR